MAEDILVPAIVFGSIVIIVGISLLYSYYKERMRHQERLQAIEKGIALKDLYANLKSGNNCLSKRDYEIFSGTKIMIIGLFLSIAIYVSSGEMRTAVWGLFISGIGLAKIIVGLLIPKSSGMNSKEEEKTNEGEH